jgi:Zn-dependent protease
MQFKCREVTVSVGFPFAAAVTLMFLYDTSGTAVISVCAALLHEIGHLLCLFWYGETPQSLKLGLAGMEIVRAKGQKLSFYQEIMVSLAGPLVNLALFALLATLSGWGAGERLMEAAMVNFMLALFNLLPVSALDGGRAMYAQRLRHNVWLPFARLCACCHARLSAFFCCCKADIIFPCSW